jgi:hypothetical protein
MHIDAKTFMETPYYFLFLGLKNHKNHSEEKHAKEKMQCTCTQILELQETNLQQSTNTRKKILAASEAPPVSSFTRARM